MAKTSLLPQRNGNVRARNSRCSRRLSRSAIETRGAADSPIPWRSPVSLLPSSFGPALLYFVIANAVIKLTRRGVLALSTRLRRQLDISDDTSALADPTPKLVSIRLTARQPIARHTGERLREFNDSEAALASKVKSPDTMNERLILNSLVDCG